MGRVHFRFYEELNDFLPPERRKVGFDYRFRKCSSVKDMIESLGVPHTEIDLILVNGQSVDFSYQVQEGDHISVYPVFERLDISGLTRLRPQPLRQVRFVVDVNLGRLARYLRLLGFDACYQNHFTDKTLARISHDESRILLTRDRRLLQHKIITHGYFVRETAPRKQLLEVMHRLDLFGLAKPLIRCTHCNGMLEDVAKAAIQHRLLPRTRQEHDRFRRCPGCEQLYWHGSHYDKLRAWTDGVLAEANIHAGGDNGDATTEKGTFSRSF